MKVARYFLCGFFSVILHGLTLSAKPVEKINLPSENPPTSLNLQFMSFTAPPAQNSYQTQTEPQEKLKATESITEKTPNLETLAKPSPLPKVEKTKVKKENKPEKAIPKKTIEKKVTKKIDTKKPPSQHTEPKKTPVKESEIKNTSIEVKKAPDTTQADNSQSANSARPLITKPSFKIKPKHPPYPHHARRRGLEGTVLLEIWLDKRGKKEKVLVLTSSGHAILDKAALKAVNQWQFNHHEIQGKASASRLHIPIRFNLD